MTDTTAPVDRKAELKAQIEIADRVLWETRDGRSYPRLVRELRAAEGA